MKILKTFWTSTSDDYDQGMTFSLNLHISHNPILSITTADSSIDNFQQSIAVSLH
uniref:Uncharacterized protein n=1 Tax=Anguilla anguilla TaxID=7936 RepID=A0A0E9XHB0_ANGAN